jgi:hypothetical protein
MQANDSASSAEDTVFSLLINGLQEFYCNSVYDDRLNPLTARGSSI